MPHADAAAADPLAHGQLQEEERDPNDDQQHQVGHQVGTWGGGRDVGGRLEHGSQVREGWQPGPTVSATSPIILKLSQVLGSSRNALAYTCNLPHTGCPDLLLPLGSTDPKH